MILKLVNNHKGFTLIELMVAVSIIGILSTIATTSLSLAKAKARDARRISDMNQIQSALEMYKSVHGYYPLQDSSNGDWEISNEDGGDFLGVLRDDGYFPSGAPVDPVNNNGKYYYYYRYGAGGGRNCPLAGGDFYVLGVTDMESSTGAYSTSPGFSCPGRNWQLEFDWVTGSYTNN